MGRFILTYLRNTHDENGQPWPFTPDQEDFWSKHYIIGGQLSSVSPKTSDVIAEAAQGYCQQKGIMEHFSKEVVEDILSEMVLYGLVTSNIDEVDWR